MPIQGRSLLSITDYDRDDFEELFELTTKIKRFFKNGQGEDPRRVARNWDIGRVDPFDFTLANVFLEPSTRTRLSFDAACQRLGGNVITVAGSEGTSMQKGESLEDTISTISCYVDVIALRSPDQGAAHRAAEVSIKPIINAGDGAGEHPTQTLADIYTIQQFIGGIDGKVIMFFGDNIWGRAVNSLKHALAGYDCEIVCENSFVNYKPYSQPYDGPELEDFEIERFMENLKRADIVYVTRLQKERCSHENTVWRGITLDYDTIQMMKKGAYVLHPLPRREEMNPSADKSRKTVHWNQVENAMYVRMALLKTILDHI